MCCSVLFTGTCFFTMVICSKTLGKDTPGRMYLSALDDGYTFEDLFYPLLSSFFSSVRASETLLQVDLRWC